MFASSITNLVYRFGQGLEPTTRVEACKGSILVISSLALNFQTRVEINGIGKHSSLFWYGNNYSRKMFYSIGSQVGASNAKNVKCFEFLRKR